VIASLDALFNFAETETRELVPTGTSTNEIFSKAVRTIDTYGRVTSVEIRDGAGTARRKRTFESYDLDNRAGVQKDWPTTTTFNQTDFTYNQDTDQLESMIEGDQTVGVSEVDFLYGMSVEDKGRLVGFERKSSSPPITPRLYSYTERGEVRQSALTTAANYKDGRWLFDGFGRVESDTNLGANVTRTLTYSDLAQTAEETTAVGTSPAVVVRRIRREFDALGRPTRLCDLASTPTATTCPTTSFAGNELVYHWDDKGDYAGQGSLTDDNNLGRLGYVEDRGGATFYEFDTLGRVTAVARYSVALLTVTLDLSRLTRTSYTYNGFGAVEKITYPSGRMVTFGYGNDKLRPTTVTVTVASPFTTHTAVASDIVWDAAGGGPLTWSWGAASSGNLHVTERDLRGQIVRIEDTWGATTKSKWRYAYDGDGDLTREDDDVSPTSQVAATTAPQHEVYGEHVSRDVLTSWEDSGSARSIEVLIASGRRDTETGPTGKLTYNYIPFTGVGLEILRDKSNTSLTLSEERGFGYDALARMTAIDLGFNGSTDITLSYGPLGDVRTATSSGGVFTYVRDHEMRRVSTAGPTSVLRTWRYGLGRVPLEEIQGLATTSWIFLGGVPIAAVASSTAPFPNGGNNLFYAYSDRLNTPRKVIRNNNIAGIERRLVMDPWSNGTVFTDFVSWGPQPSMSLRRPGQVQDGETGLVENGYRTLVPDVGQYTSPEPLHREAILDESYGPQAYSYARGRPLYFIDPDGRSAQSPDPVFDPGKREEQKSCDREMHMKFDDENGYLDCEKIKEFIKKGCPRFGGDETRSEFCQCADWFYQDKCMVSSTEPKCE
jgi:RHS repeat-associated protein